MQTKRYTQQELRWLRDLVDKAILESEQTLDICEKSSSQFTPLVELRRDNMKDLREKLNSDIARRADKGSR